MNITKDDLILISNTIKTLSMDAVQKANSGHPGLPMGCSDIAAVLWTKFIRYNPDDPGWSNRDRFILSAGHGSMLLYSVLHCAGYDISLDDLKKFRQFKSKTPGHPEFRHTPGVETTTGPLGQGFANGVGMAMAQEILGQEFNSDGSRVIDHFIYGLVSDGDIMEGISSEAASLAGHMGLGRIVYIYDSNGISIEGGTELAFSEDVAGRFRAYNWHVQEIDGHDFSKIETALSAACSERGKPSIIIAKTKIAKGSPNKEGSEESHGAPLGEAEVSATKTCLGWDCEANFHVPQGVYDIFTERRRELSALYVKWKSQFKDLTSGEKWKSFFAKPDIDKLRTRLPAFAPDKAVATRTAGGKVLEALFKEMPNLVGGSADLSPSTKTFVKGFSSTGKNMVGRNIHFGIREHAMGAIQNGIAYYGGIIPFTSTFFVFMDYMRPPMRIAALSGLNCIYIFTHDSFFVGEDGPTHQPVEHLAAARAIPNLTVIRPADAEETKEAWLAALASDTGPVMITLSRQDLPVIKREKNIGAENLRKGAYIIHDTDTIPDIIILSSGSEVHISIEAAQILKKDKINARVVSFPSWELFDRESDDYRNKVLPGDAVYAVVEAGIKMGWEKYTGRNALFITMEDFGISAPAKVLSDYLGFTPDNIAGKTKNFLKDFIKHQNQHK